MRNLAVIVPTLVNQYAEDDRREKQGANDTRPDGRKTPDIFIGLSGEIDVRSHISRAMLQPRQPTPTVENWVALTQGDASQPNFAPALRSVFQEWRRSYQPRSTRPPGCVVCASCRCPQKTPVRHERRAPTVRPSAPRHLDSQECGTALTDRSLRLQA